MAGTPLVAREAGGKFDYRLKLKLLFFCRLFGFLDLIFARGRYLSQTAVEAGIRRSDEGTG